MRYCAHTGGRTDTFTITCCFKDLSTGEQGKFLELLTTEPGGESALYITLKAQLMDPLRPNRISVTTRTGPDGKGPTLDGTARELLKATYLRPLRDAEAELRAGRGSRLSHPGTDSVRALVRPVIDTPLVPLGRLERDPGTDGGRVRALLLDMLTVPLGEERTWRSLTDRRTSTLLALTDVRQGDLSVLDQAAVFTSQGSALALRGNAAPLSSIAGTIQSAKGETHAATLIVDCLGRTGRRYDVKEAIAFLADQGDLNRAPETVKQAMQLIFVGATRPTHLLAFATLREHAAPHVDALEARGWSICDVAATR
ncbi:hypothetical protein ACFWBF_08235 [Streptomyces sp. NPDC060028]|uniref:hypothetical protein n=1 Tax=Streptomyces sp. NPDC060028 TaxID=3347041 RepID=UPI0036AA0AC7